jgi:hypothetical protein
VVLASRLWRAGAGGSGVAVVGVELDSCCGV